jgi:hypothetical protein
MVAQAPDGRTGRVAGAAGIALLLAGLTLLLEPESWRPAAAALLVAGLAVGAVAAMRLRTSDRLRTPMERLNDAAFLVVIAIVALIGVRLARPWTAALPGLVGGVLVGLSLRPQVVRASSDSRPSDPSARSGPGDPGVPSGPGAPSALGGPGRPDPGQAAPPPPDRGRPDPGHAGPPPADPGAPEPGG